MSTVESLKANVMPFASVTESGDAIAQYFHSFGDSKVLLIGDASHGTSEFYSIRAEITKYMIEHHGFDIIAGEADWPDAAAVDRDVRHGPGPGQGSIELVKKAEKRDREPAFMRFPTWMWRNMEVRDFVQWLREYNKTHFDSIGFYGLDLYSMSTSIKAVIQYLDSIDKEMAGIARK
ncbi:Fc.00g105270.m01.CDS01 [Cosmosporella sp. VM-42]